MTLGICALVLATPAAAHLGDAPERQRAVVRHGRQAEHWTSLATIETRQAIEVRRQRVQRRLVARLQAASATRAIRVVFGRYAAEALAVARCESGLSEWAQNGQYLGLFQMGTSARSRYGHGASPYVQAQAAHAYFVDSGRSWGPWSCKPA
jgi:hypothetical protein